MTSPAATATAPNNPFAQAIAIAHTSSPEMLAILAGAVIGVLLFIVMVAVYFAAATRSPSPPLPLAPSPLFIPPYTVGERAVIQEVAAPDPVGVFRTIPDPNAAVIETGPMSAIVMPDADADEGWTIVGLGTHSEELAEELALHASWLPQARRHELSVGESSPLITILGEEDAGDDFDDDVITPQILAEPPRRPTIRRISPASPRYENHA